MPKFLSLFRELENKMKTTLIICFLALFQVLNINFGYGFSDIPEPAQTVFLIIFIGIILIEWITEYIKFKIWIDQ